VIRQFPYSTGGLTTLAVASAQKTLGRALPRSDFSGGDALIDYRGDPGTFKTVSFSDLVAGRLDPRLFRGNTVVVGADAPTLQDVHATSTSGHSLMSGPEVQANAIWTALHGIPLRRARTWLDLLAIACLGLVAPLANLRLRALGTTLVGVLAALAYAGVAQLAFDAGTTMALTYPAAALALGLIGTLIGSHFSETGARRRADQHSHQLEIEVLRRTEEVRATQREVIRRLGQAAEWRDQDTGIHIERMSHYCYELGRAAGLDKETSELLRHASAMHDVGKIGIPDRILQKPTKLDPDEWEHMKSHTTIGANILAGSTSSLIQMAEVIALTHHEHWDGGGYPFGLKGEQIPLVGRICAICDVFDALLSTRPYKDAWPFEAAVDQIKALRATQLDPQLVDTFIALVPSLRIRDEQQLATQGADEQETASSHIGG